MGNDPAQSAFQLADIGGNFLSQKFRNLLRQLNPELTGFVFQNADTQVKIRRMNVGNQAAAEAGTQARFDSFQISRRFIRGDNNLTSFFNQRVKGIEELFLCCIFAAHKLNVVNHQNVNRTELFFESRCIFITQRPHKFIHKLFSGEIYDIAGRILLLDMPGDGVHQVGFSETDTGIQK